MDEETARKYAGDIVAGLEQLHVNFILDNNLDVANVNIA